MSARDHEDESDLEDDDEEGISGRGTSPWVPPRL